MRFSMYLPFLTNLLGLNLGLATVQMQCDVTDLGHGFTLDLQVV
jgi:hypothetical protein